MKPIKSENNNPTPVLLVPVALLVLMLGACAAGPQTAPDSPVADAPQQDSADGTASASETPAEQSAPSTAGTPAEPPAESQTAEAASQGTAPQPQTATEPAAQPQAPAARYTPQQVASIIRTMVDHRRTIYSVSANEYLYYIGGTLTAVYHPDNGQLQVTPENGEQEATCIYRNEGILEPGPIDQGQCDDLLRALEDSLTAP